MIEINFLFNFLNFFLKGEAVRADINGKLVLKSYLKGEPEVHIGLSQDLIIRSRTEANYPNRDCPILDDINFHSCVRGDFFDRDRFLYFNQSKILFYYKILIFQYFFLDLFDFVHWMEKQ